MVPKTAGEFNFFTGVIFSVNNKTVLFGTECFLTVITSIQRTSELCALEKRVSATRVLASTASSQVSCAR